MSLDVTQNAVLSPVIEERLQSLPPGARKLYSALRKMDKGGLFPMSVPALAREAGVARRTILNASPQLEKTGLIAIEKGSGGKPNRYRILAVGSSDPVPLTNTAVQPLNSSAVAGAVLPGPNGTPGAILGFVAASSTAQSVRKRPDTPSSVITSKPAIRDHFKTGQRNRGQDVL